MKTILIQDAINTIFHKSEVALVIVVAKVGYNFVYIAVGEVFPGQQRL